jgi:subtilisin family serine protease
VAAASVVLVCSAGPAVAQEPVSDEVREVPAALTDDLSAAEERTLSDLTEGTGVRLEAFVETPDGPEIVTLDADARSDAAAAARVLDQQPSVGSAGLSSPVRVTGGTFDQYGNTMVRSEQARSELDAGALADVVVAVLDTGVAPHPELAAALVPGQNFTDSPGGALDATDRHQHGTHVAGTVGADAGSDVEGVAPGVRIMPVKVLGDDGRGWSDWTANGIIWATDHGADVINMSLSGTGYSSVQASAVTYARSKGVTVIAAAGNDNTSAPRYPAADAGVIGVSAVDEVDAKADFSNYGSYVDVAAPGVDILSTYFTGSYAYMSGTSMAAPHVAGVAALVEAAAPGLTPEEVEEVLTGTAIDLGPAGRDDVFGSGRVDALLAVRGAEALAGGGMLPGNQPPVAVDDTVELAHDPGATELEVTANDTDPDGDALAVLSAAAPAHGTATVADGRLTYTPSGNGPSSDTFAYTVGDRRGGTSTASVTVQLAGPDPLNRAPVAAADRRTLSYDSPWSTFGVLWNDSDPDGDALRIVSFTQPSHGTLTSLDSGVFSYAAPAGEWGTPFDDFTYTVSDSRGGFATATVTIDVKGPNNAPVATDETYTLEQEFSSTEIFVTGNDTDADDDYLQVTSVGAATHGWAAPAGGGWVRYTPGPGLAAAGRDSFSYTVSDSRGGTATARLTVVLAAPDPIPAVGQPSAPHSVTVTPQKSAVRVSWAAPVTDGGAPVTGYQVTAFKGDALVRSVHVDGSTKSALLTGLANGTAYRIGVEAVNAAGAGPRSTTVTATPRTTPGAAKVTSVTAKKKAALVRWAKPASTGGAAISGYVVRAYSGGKLVKTVTVRATARSVTVTGLKKGKAYAFRVLAKNAAGLGKASAASKAVKPR